MITLRFPDGSSRDVEAGLNPLEIAQGLSRSLAKAALAAKVNGTTVSLLQPVAESCDFQILTWDDAEGRAVYWHSSAHVMAQAVKELWPAARLDDGPPEETGFYYDISFPAPLTEEDFPRIEAKVAEILARKQSLVRRELSPAEAREFFKARGEDFKLDLIDAIEARGESISVYDQGSWTDLCRGPHLVSTEEIRNFKVMSIAGAYLRGNQENEQLTRLRAVTFPKQQMLADHLFFLEESKKRDHRRLGKELDLFSFHEVGPGFPFWHPNGMVVYNQLASFWRELHAADGYSEIKTPIILSEELWHKSGHWANYHENMYFTEIDEQTYAVKPMNCPGLRHGLLGQSPQLSRAADPHGRDGPGAPA
jgi:threonyl-tRNA synthetase